MGLSAVFGFIISKLCDFSLYLFYYRPLLLFVFVNLGNMTCPRPFRVWDSSRLTRKSLVASSLVELKIKGLHFYFIIVIVVPVQIEAVLFSSTASIL